MFVMLLLGVFLRKKNIADRNSLNVINQLCFKVFLAVNVYYNIYKVNIAEVLNWRLLIPAAALICSPSWLASSPRSGAAIRKRNASNA